MYSLTLKRVYDRINTMDGKIALEEHWATAETMADSQRLVGTSSGWDELHRRLLDVHDERLSKMDQNGIELSILSLNAPAIQAILDPKHAITAAKLAKIKNISKSELIKITTNNFNKLFFN